MTRVEFKFKIPYGAIREAHFQTDTRLSLKKKKKKKETQYLIKRSNRLFTEQKKQKKKKSKPLKPKSYFPIKLQITNSYSLKLQILRCSFKHTNRTCVATKTLKPKSYLPIKIQTHSDYRSSLFLQTYRSDLRVPLYQADEKEKPLQQLKPLQQWKSPFVPCNRRFINYPASALRTINDSKGRHFPPFLFSIQLPFQGFLGKERVQSKVGIFP